MRQNRAGWLPRTPERHARAGPSAEANRTHEGEPSPSPGGHFIASVRNTALTKAHFDTVVPGTLFRRGAARHHGAPEDGRTRAPGASFPRVRSQMAEPYSAAVPFVPATSVRPAAPEGALGLLQQCLFKNRPYLRGMTVALFNKTHQFPQWQNCNGIYARSPGSAQRAARHICRL